MQKMNSRLIILIESLFFGVCLLASLHKIFLNGGGGLINNFLLFVFLSIFVYFLIEILRPSRIVHIFILFFCSMILIVIPTYLNWFIREFL